MIFGRAARGMDTGCVVWRATSGCRQETAAASVLKGEIGDAIGRVWPCSGVPSGVLLEREPLGKGEIAS